MVRIRKSPHPSYQSSNPLLSDHANDLAVFENRLKKEYYRGLCHHCGVFPDYKVIYKMDGITLLEYYCEEHKAHVYE